MSDDAAIANIRDAIEAGNASLVKELFTAYPQYVNYAYRGGTWLGKAVYCGDLMTVSLLLELGLDANAEQRLTANVSDVPLDTALGTANVEIVRLLLTHGADANQNRQIIGAVQADKNALELVKLLEQFGADIHKEFLNENTGEMMNALSTAIDWGKDDVADYLRSRGCVMPGQSASTTKVPQSLADEVVEYFENHFGRVRKQSLVEIVPTEPAIAVHVVPASRDHDRVTLFTTGMSSQPMNVGKDQDKSFALGEVFIELPGDWPYQKIEDPEHGWPIHWLRSMAKAPHKHNTALGPAMIVTRQKQSKPLAPNLRFDSVLLLAEREFQSNAGQTVRLYRMVPLHPEERKLGQKDLPALMRSFDEHGVSFVFDANRPNLAG